MGDDDLFRRESGQFQAVCSEVQEILTATKVVIEKIKTDPPPPIAKRLAGAGYYQMAGRAAPVEQIRTAPGGAARPKKEDKDK